MRHATNTINHVDDALIGFTFNAPKDDAVTMLEGISGDGDSGGPAFMCEELALDPGGLLSCTGQITLLGVSSFQFSEDEPYQQGVYGVFERYARISSHADWIETTMATGQAGMCEGWASDDPTKESTALEGCQGSHGAPPWLLAGLGLLALGARRQRARALGDGARRRAVDRCGL